MANRTLRRAPNSTRKPVSGASSGAGDIPVTIDGAGNVVPDESADTGNDDNQSDRAEHNVASESDRTSVIGAVEVDPSELGEFIASGGVNTSSDGADAPRQRRKRGPNKRTKEAQTIDVSAIQMLHTTLAVLLKEPDIMLDATEAQQLSDTYKEFCKYHDVPLVSPKRISEFNFFGALLTVYGTRVVGIVRNKRAQRRGPQVVQPIAAGKAN